MKPAWSVITFTVTSGAGLGWLIWLLLARWFGVHVPDRLFAVSAALAVVLLVTGLVCSTLHLANRRNAWRALAGWRSSWLSREGLLALALFPAGAVTAYAIVQGNPGLERVAGLFLLGLAIGVLYCTAMIYAVLKTVPRWHCWHVRLAYPLLALASGGVLWCASARAGALDVAAAERISALLLLAGGILKYAYWKHFARSRPIDDQRASALRLNGRVRLLDAGHTGPTFLTNEFGFELAPTRALLLKWLALTMAFALPLLVMLLAPVLSAFAALLCLAGLMVERWLFFAEAEHVVRAFH